MLVSCIILLLKVYEAVEQTNIYFCFKSLMIMTENWLYDIQVFVRVTEAKLLGFVTHQWDQFSLFFT